MKLRPEGLATMAYSTMAAPCSDLGMSSGIDQGITRFYNSVSSEKGLNRCRLRDGRHCLFASRDTRVGGCLIRKFDYSASSSHNSDCNNPPNNVYGHVRSNRSHRHRSLGADR